MTHSVQYNCMVVLISSVMGSTVQANKSNVSVTQSGEFTELWSSLSLNKMFYFKYLKFVLVLSWQQRPV